MLTKNYIKSILLAIMIASTTGSYAADSIVFEQRLGNTKNLKANAYQMKKMKTPQANHPVNNLKAAGHQGAPIGPIITTPFNSNCAQGFSKVGEKKSADGGSQWTDWYVCGTPRIVCPAQRQSNGLYSSVKAKAIVTQVGGDPDGGQISFHVQYKCDYSYSAQPVG